VIAGLSVAALLASLFFPNTSIDPSRRGTGVRRDEGLVVPVAPPEVAVEPAEPAE